MTTSFRGKYFFLSNFYPAEITFEEITYPTLEHAFQAAKFRLVSDRLSIKRYQTPGEAKRLGRRLNKRTDWDEVKDEVMFELMCLKFGGHINLAEALIETAPHELIEGNNWGDKYWGAVNVKGVWVGENRLGKYLMIIREELIAEREAQKEDCKIIAREP